MSSTKSSSLLMYVAIAFIIGILLGYGIGYVTIQPQPVETTSPTETTGQTETTTPTETTSPMETTGKVELIVIGPWAGDEMNAFITVLNKFMEEHPNIEVEYRIYRSEDLASIAPPQFEAGMTPGDVIFSAWGWWVKEQGQKGHLMDLSGLVNTDEYITGILDPVKDGDKIYGLPFTAWAKPGFWYRKSFFQQHGLSEPESWEDFINLLDQIKQIDGIEAPIVTGDTVGWPISDVVEHFIITFGGPDMQRKLISGEKHFQDEDVKTIFQERIVYLLENGYFSEPIEWTKAIEEWWNGKYALYFMGTWLTGMVDDPDDLGFFPLPGCQGVVMGTDYIFVPKYTEHPEEAKLLAKWLATEGQRVHAGTNAGKFATWKQVEIEDHWAPMQAVYQKLSAMQPVPDLDDSIGGDWQTLFWDQLKLLWVNPDKLDDVLRTLDENFPSSS